MIIMSSAQGRVPELARHAAAAESAERVCQGLGQGQCKGSDAGIKGQMGTQGTNAELAPGCQLASTNSNDKCSEGTIWCHAWH